MPLLFDHLLDLFLGVIEQAILRLIFLKTLAWFLNLGVDGFYSESDSAEFQIVPFLEPIPFDAIG